MYTSLEASPFSAVLCCAQSCLTSCNYTDCSPPVSSVHGVFQLRILEWVAISFSRGSSRPRDRTQVSHIGGRRFNLWATREAQNSVIAISHLRARVLLTHQAFHYSVISLHPQPPRSRQSRYDERWSSWPGKVKWHTHCHTAKCVRT